MRFCKSLCISVIAFVVITCAIGVGFSYSAHIEQNNTFGSDYCSVEAVVDDRPVIDAKVVEISSEPSTFAVLFSSDGINFQEDLLLDYVHTNGTDIILIISFSCVASSTNLIFKCLDLVGNTVGSALLSGDSTKTGTISGILLPLSGSTEGTIGLKFQVEGIGVDTPVMISFSVHPLEVSS